MRETHSPGPWRWAVGASQVLEAADGKRLLEVKPGAVWNLSIMDERLIAAVPELLQALQRLEWAVREWDEEAHGLAAYDEALKKARDLIRRVRGG